MGSASDLYSASVPITMYAISRYTGPRYNGTRLYNGLSVEHYYDVIMRDGVSNHQPRDCLFNRLFIRRSKKT